MTGAVGFSSVASHTSEVLSLRRQLRDVLAENEQLLEEVKLGEECVGEAREAAVRHEATLAVLNAKLAAALKARAVCRMCSLSVSALY